MKIEFKNPAQMTTTVLLTDGENDVRLRVEISDAHEVWIHSHDVSINETSEPFARLEDAREYLDWRLEEMAAELGMERVELAPKAAPAAAPAPACWRCGSTMRAADRFADRAVPGRIVQNLVCADARCGARSTAEATSLAFAV